MMKSSTHMNIEQSREKEDEPDDEEGDEAGGATAGVEVEADASSDEERDEEDAVQSSKKVNQEEDNDFEEPEEEEKMSEGEGEDEEVTVEEKTPHSDRDKRTQESQHSHAESDKTDDNTSGTEDDELDERAQDVVNQHNIIHKYSYDKKNHLWCKAHLWLTMKCHRIHMSQVVRSCAARSIIHQVPGVKRAIVMETNGKYRRLRYVIGHCWTTNSVNDNGDTYEAANRVIIREVKNVFAVYGIEVDPRHLSLVADYMTHNGSYVAMNRNGIRLNPSFIQKMTFEMPLEKIRQASIQGRDDSLRAPSARVMMGQECRQGTGLFQLRHAEAKKKKKKQVGGK
ncbi:hypothetical protein WDU94_003769 [Cyamophila willieti]